VRSTAWFSDVQTKLQSWNEQPVPPQLKQRLLREHERWRLVDQQIKNPEKERTRRIRTVN
jgi:hypothetical protein